MCECLKTILIGQSAAKCPGDWIKVQRLVLVISYEAIPNHMQEEKTSSAEQLVICQVCNKSMKTITNTHLKRHDLKKKDYLLLYPGASLGKCSWLNEWRNSERNKQHCKDNAIKIINDPFLVEKRNKNRNVAMSKESYTKNLSKAMKAYAQTPAGKAKLSNKPVTQRMRMSNFDRWEQDFGYDIAVEKQLDWQKKNIIPSKSKYTKIEIIVADALREAGYEIITQYAVLHYYCDIFVPKLNLIIEVNGDYWHANPEIFRSNDIVGQKNATASQVWEYDAKRISALKQIGYNVEVIWEKQIKTLQRSLLVDDIVRCYEKS